MIIAITPSGALELREPDDFKGFKIVVEESGWTDEEIAAALNGVATLDDEGRNAWVSCDALRHWQGTSQPAEWIASFDKMVETVKRFGWVDEAKGAVRGHIERAT
jgi:hypothetical protein